MVAKSLAEIMVYIRKIIALEDVNHERNFRMIENLSLEALRIINEKGIEIAMSDWILYQFLDDYDVRFKDSRYKNFQTENVLKKIGELPTA